MIGYFEVVMFLCMNIFQLHKEHCRHWSKLGGVVKTLTWADVLSSFLTAPHPHFQWLETGLNSYTRDIKPLLIWLELIMLSLDVCN